MTEKEALARHDRKLTETFLESLDLWFPDLTEDQLREVIVMALAEIESRKEY